MLRELALTPATIVIVLLVITWAVWAIRRLMRRGMCDCGDKCDGRSAKFGKAGTSTTCAHCTVASGIVARMESLLER